ncbi:MAG: response regulator [Sphingomicrobium sp.]
MKASLVILDVEDDPVIGLAVQDALESAGYQVKLISSGSDAISRLEAEEFKPAGLFTDIRLGDASGWDVGRRARELYSAIPIVYMTGGSAMDHSSMGVPQSVLVQQPFASVQRITASTTLELRRDNRIVKG